MKKFPHTLWLVASCCYIAMIVSSCSTVRKPIEQQPKQANAYLTMLKSLDWGNDTCYVYGHKTPDVDAATSALSFARLMRQLGYNCKAKASSAINRETSYISKRFGFSIPGVVGGTGDWGIFPAPVPLTTVKFAQHKRNDIFSGSDSCTHDFTIEYRVFMVLSSRWDR